MDFVFFLFFVNRVACGWPKGICTHAPEPLFSPLLRVFIYLFYSEQVKLNTDESPSVATEYGIRSIPTVMIFKGGQKLDTVIGAVPKSTLTGTIEKYL